jgi:cytochrome P450
MKHLILFILLLGSFAASAVVIDCRKILKGEERVKPPGPHSFLKAMLFNAKPQTFIQWLMNVYGEKAGVYLVEVPKKDQDKLCDPQRPLYVIAGADYIGASFKNPDLFDRAYGGTLSTKLGNDSVFMYNDRSQADEWRLAHEALAPFFRPQFISDQYIPMIREQAADVAKEWTRRSKRRGTVQINEDLEHYALATVFSSLFGETLDRKSSGEFSAVLAKVFGNANEDEAKKIRASLETYVQPAMKRARSAFKGEDSSTSLIQHLLFIQKREGLPDSWIMDQLITIYFAGQVTTKVMLANAFALLADRPEWQDRLRKEYASATDLHKGVPQLENFLNEVLRLYPPVPLLSRVTTADVKIGPYFIPKNSNVVIDMYAGFIRESTFGAEPQEFRPERFDEVTFQKTQFCPFGFGPRICIGQYLAMLEAKVLIGEILQNFSFELNRDYTLPTIENQGLLSILSPLVLKLEEPK